MRGVFDELFINSIAYEATCKMELNDVQSLRHLCDRNLWKLD
jgi:hypothetical protein